MGDQVNPLNNVSGQGNVNNQSKTSSAPKVYVLIIDPDDTLAGERHLLNAKRSFERAQSYNPDGIFLVAPKRTPGQFVGKNVAFYQDPSKDSLRLAFAAIKKVIRPNDHLIIHVTGHGDYNQRTRQACLVFPGGELNPADPSNVTEREFQTMLAQLPKVNRSIFMDQCFGGEWVKTIASPNTFLVANSGREETFCEPWVRRLNAPDVPDLNRDGRISNVERVAHATKANQIFGVSVSIGSEYIDYGYSNLPAAPIYPSEVNSIRSLAELKKWQAMNPYGVIVLEFTAEWCQPCAKFYPHLQKMARSYGGKVLFLSVDLTNDYEKNEVQKKYGIRPLPAVFILKGNALVEAAEHETAFPEKLKRQIDQMLSGTHPALVVLREKTRVIAEDKTIPIALRVRALKEEIDRNRLDENWVIGFFRDPEWHMRRAAMEIIKGKYFKEIGRANIYRELREAKDPGSHRNIIKDIFKVEGNPLNLNPEDPGVIKQFLEKAKGFPAASIIEERLFKLLLPMLEDNSIEVRSEAASYIMTLDKYPEAIKKFIGQAIRHPDPLVRYQAAEVICKMSDPSFFPYILELAQDSDPLVQEEMIYLMAAWRLPEFIPVLAKIVASPKTDPINKMKAEHYLKKIKEKPRSLSGRGLQELKLKLNKTTYTHDRQVLAAEIWMLEKEKLISK